MSIKRILILEDDLHTQSVLTHHIANLEDELNKQSNPIQLATTILSEYTQVEEYINKTNHPFDIILLDRDDKIGGSFHVIDLNKFPKEKIIGISSTPPYNELLKQKGITKIVWKDYSNLDNFAAGVIRNMKLLISQL